MIKKLQKKQKKKLVRSLKVWIPEQWKRLADTVNSIMASSNWLITKKEKAQKKDGFKRVNRVTPELPRISFKSDKRRIYLNCFEKSSFFFSLPNVASSV